jgi:hypothetical protein
MSKWPVVVINLQNVGFSSIPITLKQAEEEIYKSSINEAFEQYDYVLFISLAEEACLIKYGEITKESYQRLLKELKIDELDNMDRMITSLWLHFGEKVSPNIQKFYRLYKGTLPLEDITTSLQFLTKFLKTFFGKEVIVLVDEHDAPAQNLYGRISLNNTENNIKVIEAIKIYSEAITQILKSVGKGNIGYTKKILIFGVSNSIANQGNSGFNNVDVHNIFNPKYSKYFAMTQAEVSSTIDRLFKIQPEPRNMMISNIEKWYNGYYQNGTSPLYSIYSAGLYINDCYEEYESRGITPEDKRTDWIPGFRPYWAESTSSTIFSDYLSIGFEKIANNNFLLNIGKGDSVWFPK